jgi:hypothetical protein
MQMMLAHVFYLFRPPQAHEPQSLEADAVDAIAAFFEHHNLLRVFLCSEVSCHCPEAPC